VRLSEIKKLSNRQISVKCDCHRNTVKHYLKLYSEWKEQEGAAFKTLSRLDGLEYISYLEDIINNYDWVARPLQTQLIEEVARAEEEIIKERRNHKKIKTMDVYEWMRKHRGNSKALSYSTVYLARKLKK
jgi:uridine kinase